MVAMLPWARQCMDQAIIQDMAAKFIATNWELNLHPVGDLDHKLLA